MKEDFLHYLWKFKKFNFNNLKSSQGDDLEVLVVGEHNHDSGPDFFNAKLKIGDQLWAGNIEIHIKSSDWYLHNHETDKNYNNVILHVVWDHDMEVFNGGDIPIPTLALKDYVRSEVLNNYQNLFINQKKFINCENDIGSVDGFILNSWLERLYFERLEEKSKVIQDELKKSKNDWEVVLFKMLMKNFGLKVNGDSFYSIANAMDYSVVRKVQHDVKLLEALFFGLAGWFTEDSYDEYHLNLKKEYQYLKKKFPIDEDDIVPPKFYKLRPQNFPTIRLSQLANLYQKHQHLFSKLMDANTIADYYSLLGVSSSDYWFSHFTFGKESPKSKKSLSKDFMDLLIINTVLPLKFSYHQYIGKPMDDEIASLVQSLKRENNSVADHFSGLKAPVGSAMESQAILQLYNNYCTKNKCLQCAVGNHLIKQ